MPPVRPAPLVGVRRFDGGVGHGQRGAVKRLVRLRPAGDIAFQPARRAFGTPVVDLDGTNLIGNPQRVAPRTDTDRPSGVLARDIVLRQELDRCRPVICRRGDGARKAVIAFVPRQVRWRRTRTSGSSTNAQDLNFDSCLARFDAASEAALLLGIYKVLRETRQVTLRVDDVATPDRARSGRGGCGSRIRASILGQKLMRVLAMDGNFADNKITLTLWG